MITDEKKRDKIEQRKAEQNREMLQILEEEQNYEAERDAMIKDKTGEERERLEIQFGKDRSKAQKRIKNMMKKHQEELANL